MENNSMFAAMVLCEEQEVDLFGLNKPIAMSWADGMVGCIPVFNSKQKAKDVYPDAGVLEFVISNRSNETNNKLVEELEKMK